MTQAFENGFTIVCSYVHTIKEVSESNDYHDFSSSGQTDVFFCIDVVLYFLFYVSCPLTHNQIMMSTININKGYINRSSKRCFTVTAPSMTGTLLKRVKVSDNGNNEVKSCSGRIISSPCLVFFNSMAWKMKKKTKGSQSEALQGTYTGVAITVARVFSQIIKWYCICLLLRICPQCLYYEIKVNFQDESIFVNYCRSGNHFWGLVCL